MPATIWVCLYNTAENNALTAEVELNKDLSMSGLAKQLKAEQGDLLVGVASASISFFTDHTRAVQVQPYDLVSSLGTAGGSGQDPIYAVYTPPAAAAPVQATVDPGEMTF